MNMVTKQANRCKNPVVVAMTLLLLTGLPSWSQAQLRIEVLAVRIDDDDG